MEMFKDNDEDYLNWIKKNSNGYVVNCNRNPSPNYLILHRADCKQIKKLQNKAKFWTKDYIKICSLDLKDLQTWAHDKISGRLSCCPSCKP